MLVAKVTYKDEDFDVDGGLTIGRTPDNTISFPDDPNISRNHAEIRERDGEYYLTDLGSSNGTLVNGVRLKGAHKLADRDFLILGNSKSLIFSLTDPAAAEQADDEAAADGEASDAEPEAPAAQAQTSKKMLVGAAGALALAVAIGGGAIYMASGASCAATAKIVSPEPGDTIAQPTEIEVEAENAGCVAKAVFTIDGEEFATTNGEPFEVTIDPKEHPELADGFDHVLGIELFDRYGERISQSEGVQLAFETRQVKQPASNTQVAQNTEPTNPKASAVSLVDVQEMSKRLLKQFSGNFAYNVSNKEFLKEVQKRAGEYAQEGYFDRAAQYRDQINVAFVREQNLDAPLGYYLAMSRSKFNPAKQGSEEGLFRMTNEFVTANAYNGLCGTETIGDATQNCAAKAAALYMKSMVFGVFEGDVVYAAAAFGKSPQDAGAWKATLPANRTDPWTAIKTPEEREALVRFFAAGIVAENPQKFGLKRDRPLSELYRLAM